MPIDPELSTFLSMMPDIDLDDPVEARRSFDRLLVSMRRPLPEADLLDIEDRRIPGYDGDPDVPVRIYRPKAAAAAGELSPAILLLHGGGFIVGSVEAEHVGAVLMAADAESVLVSVDYRLAPEHPYPAALRDCYAALSYVHAEAAELGVDTERVALVGTSAGGGLAAATTLFARDRGGPSICFQMLHIPELDDRLRTPSMHKFVDAPVWNQPLAEKSWQYYLGDDLVGTEKVPIYAAPARALDLSGLPPAYVSTAENDPLRDEGIAYAQELLWAGVSVELHQFPGTFHGSALVSRASVSRRAQKEASMVLRRMLGVDEG
jgi:acetyl esterase/lipase